MIKRHGIWVVAGIVLALVVFPGCREEKTAAPHESKPKVVSKNISVQADKNKPNSIEEKQAGKKKNPKDTSSAEDTKVKQGVSQSALSDAILKYDSKGRVDPFIPLFSEKKGPEASNAASDKPKRLLTPLEKMDLSQIKLVAVIKGEKEIMAMVEEASGKGYEVRIGTYMGRNSGRVSAINPDGLTVRESYKDYQGKLHERFQEVTFHRNEGGE